MWPRKGDEPLVVCPNEVEQLKLPVAREQLIIPLHMEEHRHLNGGLSLIHI